MNQAAPLPRREEDTQFCQSKMTTTHLPCVGISPKDGNLLRPRPEAMIRTPRDIDPSTSRMRKPPWVNPEQCSSRQARWLWLVLPNRGSRWRSPSHLSHAASRMRRRLPHPSQALRVRNQRRGGGRQGAHHEAHRGLLAGHPGQSSAQHHRCRRRQGTFRRAGPDRGRPARP